jgi:hypothetical protein
MIYPFKYNLSANSGFFHFTISGSTVYFQYDIINLNKREITCREQLENCS